MADDVDVTELEDLAADFATASGRLGRATAATVRKTAAKIERSAKARAPRDTGAMADSITTSYSGDGRSTEMTAFVGPSVWYGRLLEHGTANMAPHPFLAPAAAEHRADFDKDVAANIDEAI